MVIKHPILLPIVKLFQKATGIWKEIMSILLKDILKIYLNQ